MNMRQSKQSHRFQLGGLLKTLKVFYCQELHLVVRMAYKRGFLFSLFVLVLKPASLYFFSISKSMSDIAVSDSNFAFLTLQMSSSNSSSTDSRRFSEFMSDSTFLLNWNQLIGGVHMILIAYLLSKLVICYLERRNHLKNKDSEWERLNENDICEENQSRKLNGISALFSAAYTLYAHVMFVPIVVIGMQHAMESSSQGWVGITNVVLAIPLCNITFQYKQNLYLESTKAVFSYLLISDCDFDYDVKSDDTMRKRYSLAQSLLNTAEVVLIVCIAISDSYSCIMASIYLILNFIVQVHWSYYYVRLTQMIALISMLFFCFVSISTQVAISFSGFPKNVLSFLCLVLFPLSYGLIHGFLAWKDRYSIEQFQSTKPFSAEEYDDFIRRRLFERISDGTSREKRMLFELNSLINKSTHSLSELYRHPADEQIFDERTQEDLLYSKKTLETTIFIAITQLLNEIGKEISLNRAGGATIQVSTSLNAVASYLVFLSQVSDTHRRYWMVYNFVTSKQNQSLKSQQVLHSIHRQFLQIRSIMRKSQGIASIFDLSYLEVIAFEESLVTCDTSLRIAIKQKIEILSMLKQKNIDSNVLMKCIESLQKEISSIRRRMVSLVKLNRFDFKLRELLDIYAICLSFNESEVPSASTSSARGCQSTRTTTLSTDKEKFNESTCVVFAQYETNQALRVKAVSNNFVTIFDSTRRKDQVIGQYIEAVMPQYIASIHKQLINEFLNYQSRLNEDSENIRNTDENILNQLKTRSMLHQQKLDSDLVFASTAGNTIIPIKTSIRLNPMISADSFGLTAKVTRINYNCEYVIFDQYTLNLLGITNHIGAGIFENSLKVQTSFPFLSKASNTSKTSSTVTPHEMVHPNISLEMMKNLRSDFTTSTNNSFSFVVIIPKVANSLNMTMGTTRGSVWKNNVRHLNIRFILMDIQVKGQKIRHETLKVSYLEIQNIREIKPHSSPEILLEYFDSVPNVFSVYNAQIPQKSMEAILHDLRQLKSIQENPNAVPIEFRIDSAEQQQQQSQQHLNNSVRVSDDSAEEVYVGGRGDLQIRQEQQLEYEGGEEVDGTRNKSIPLKPLLSSRQHSFIMNTQDLNSDRFEEDHLRSPRRKMDYDKLETRLTQNATIDFQIERGSTHIQLAHMRTKDDFQTSQNLLSPIHPILNTSNDHLSRLPALQTASFKASSHSLFKSTAVSRNHSSRLLNQNEMTFRNSLDQTQKVNEKNLGRASKKKMKSQKKSTKQFNNSSRISTRRAPAVEAATATAGGVNNNNNNNNGVIGERQDDISSMKSASSSSTSAKRSLNLMMADKSTVPVIKAINFIGILSFSVMMFICVLQYIGINNELVSQHEDSLVFSWPTTYSSMLSTILKDQNIVFMTTDNYVSFSSDSVKASFIAKSKSDIISSKDTVRAMLSEMEKASSDRKIFQLLRETDLEFQIGRMYNTLKLEGIDSAGTTLVTLPYPTNLQFGLILSFSFVFRYSVGLGKGRAEYFMIANQIKALESLTKVQYEMLDQSQMNSTDIQSTLLTLLLLVLSISTLCVVLVIPQYAYIQSKRDQIMQLFATFSTEKIDSFIFRVGSFQANTRQNESTTTGRFKDVKAIGRTEHQGEVRKSNIGTISSIKKVNFMLNAILVLVLMLIICAPILNKLLTQDYLSSQNLGLSTLYNVYKLRSYMLEVIAMHYNLIVMRIYPNSKPQSIKAYFDYVQSLIDRTDSINSDISQIISSQYSTSRYQQSLYDDFFFNAMKGNICEAFKRYPEYNRNSTMLSQSNCSTLYKGFLTNGVQIAIKKFQSIFPDLFVLYKIESKTEGQANMAEFLKTFDILDFTLFQEGLEAAVLSLKEFVLDRITEEFDSNQLISLVLLVYQLVLLVVVFLIGWTRFSGYLNALIHRTKVYLQIIDIDSLLENNYILTYIHQNSINY